MEYVGLGNIKEEDIYKLAKIRMTEFQKKPFNLNSSLPPF